MKYIAFLSAALWHVCIWPLAATSSASSASASSSSGSGGSGSGSGHGHHQWWVHEYEHDYVEAYIVVILVLIAMAFEIAHHRLSHLAESSFAYGAVSKEETHLERRRRETHTLWSELLHRATGEMTVLGFMAFVVWSCNQAEFFDSIAEGLEGYDVMRVPGDGPSFFHSVEVVHMHLFLGMLFYFIFLAGSVHFGLHLQEKWQSCSHTINQAYRNMEIKPGQALAWAEKQNDPRLKRFTGLRCSFLLTLKSWHNHWTFYDEEVALLMDDPGALPDMLEQFFPLGQYVSLGFRRMIDDMIEIHPTTWGAICVLSLIQAQFYLLKVEWISSKVFSGFWASVCLIFMCVTSHATHKNLRVLQTGQYANPSRDREHSRDRSLFTPRLFQVCVFIVSYEAASAIGSKHAWQGGNIAYPLVCTLLVALCGFPFGMLFGYTLARWCAWMACGSHMTEMNLLRILVILEQHIEKNDSFRRSLGDDEEAMDELIEDFERKHSHEHTDDAAVDGAAANRLDAPGTPGALMD